MPVNARQVNILRPNTAGTWTTLDQYMNRKRILQLTWVEAQSVTFAGVNVMKIDSTTHLPAGKIAVLKASPPTTFATNAGIIAAELVGTVGTGATTSHSDNLANVLNLVPLRDSVTHDEVTVNVAGVEYTVFGLIQCVNGTAEGADVGANSSENLQISTVYYAGDGTLTLTVITGTVDFCVNKVYIESQMPDVMMEGGRREELVIEPKALTSLISAGTVSAAFASGEVITIATGAGAGTGTSTVAVVPAGSTVALPATEAGFTGSNLYQVYLNGVRLTKCAKGAGTAGCVEWESATTFSINQIMDVGDVYEVEVPAL
jgi:hypothetical protein